jgi:anaerobic selenocysteine-containing dehydrogenase
LRNVPALRDVKPVPVLDINASTARALDIEDGDKVIVESPYGRISLVARLTEGIHPGVVGVPHGWPGESNDNLLMNNEICSLGIGTTPLRGTLCSVRGRSDEVRHGYRPQSMRGLRHLHGGLQAR